jgi:hypothetical protein
MGRIDADQPSVADDPKDELAVRRRLNEQHPGQRDHPSPRPTPQKPPLPAAAGPLGGGTRVANPLLVGFDSDRFESDLDTDDAEESESQESAAAPSLNGAESTPNLTPNTAAATIELTPRRVAPSSSNPESDVAATLPTGATRRRRLQLLPVGAIVATALVIATAAVLYETGKIRLNGGGAPGHALTTPSRAPHTPPAVSAATPAAHHSLLAALHIQSTIQTAGQLVHTSVVKAEAARREEVHRRALARARRRRKELARRRAQAQHHTTAATSTPAPATTYTPSTSTSAAPTATSATTTPTYTPTTPSYTPPAQTSAPATSSSSSQPGPTGAGTQSGGCDPLCK